MIPALSPEWIQARLGKVTASRVADILGRTKSGYAASRQNYLAQLVAERLTGQPTESFQNAAMAWGFEHEAEARAAYEFYQDVTVDQPGLFVPHPTIEDFGASPDGLVGEDGLVEIKCPLTFTHLGTLSTRSIPPDYMIQIQSQLACTGRRWCDFVSYDPRLPERLRLVIIRTNRDDTAISAIELEVTLFLDAVKEKIKELEAALA